MPYREGVTDLSTVEERGLPPWPGKPVDALTRESDGGRIPARRAADGTLWCATCDTTLDHTQNARRFCQKHSVEREQLLEQRRGTPATMSVPTFALLELVERHEALQKAIGVALYEFHRMRTHDRTPEPWMVDLTGAAKDLMVSVGEQVEPVVLRAQSTAARRRAAEAQAKHPAVSVRSASARPPQR